MQDATITSDDSLIKERFPSVVSTDDLIFELGKQAIKVLNLEKLLESLLQKVKAAEKTVAEVAKVKADNSAKVQSLEESNKQYEGNNRQLGNELAKVRSEVSLLKAKEKEEISQLRNKISQLTIELAKKDDEIKELREKKMSVRRKKRV